MIGIVTAKVLHGSILGLSYDAAHIVAASGRHHTDTAHDVAHITATDASCRAVGGCRDRARRGTRLNIALVGTTDAACMIVVYFMLRKRDIHVSRTVIDKSLQRHRNAMINEPFPVRKIVAVIATVASHNTSHVEGSSQVGCEVGMTVVDADGIIGIAHQATNTAPITRII